jgi:hypothetical protein
VLRLVAAVDAGLAISDFVIRPLAAAPADPGAALRGGLVFGALGLGAAVARRRGRTTETSAARPAREAELVVGGPTILAVHDGDRVVEAFWDGPTPRPPSPWRSSPTGWVWEADRDRVADPLEPATPWRPVVVALGRTSTGTLWLNLGAFRIVALGGDTSAAADRLEDLVRQLEPSVTAGAVELTRLDRGGAESGDRAAGELADSLGGRPRRGEPRGAARRAPRRGRRVPGSPVGTFFVAVASGPAADGMAVPPGADPGHTLVAVGERPDAELRLWCEDGEVRVPFLGDVTVTVPAPAVPAEGAPAHGPRRREADGEAAPSRPSRAGARKDAPGVVVRVLGPVEVSGADRTLAGKSLELVAYLASHPDGVDERRVRAALWPDRAPSAKTWSNRVSSTRRALGTDGDGSPRLGRLDGHLGRLAPSVCTDVDLLAAAVVASHEEPGPGATQALTAALAAVRGRPFAMPSGYEWAEAERHVERAERVAADAAHQVTELALAADDWRRALWATHQGLLAAPESDLLVQDRRLAHDAAPDGAGAMDGIRDLLRSIGAPDPTAARRRDAAEIFDELRRAVDADRRATIHET